MFYLRSLFILIYMAIFFVTDGYSKMTPVQKRSLIIKDGLFFPNKIHVFKGERLHLMVGNFMGHSSCVANKDLKFFVNVSPGNVVEQILRLDNLGSYSFSCPGLKGGLEVVVRLKPHISTKGHSEIERAPASVPDGTWVPKNMTESEGAW